MSRRGSGTEHESDAFSQSDDVKRSACDGGPAGLEPVDSFADKVEFELVTAGFGRSRHRDRDVNGTSRMQILW